MASGDSSPSISAQINQVLLAISFAYDNFIEINGPRTTGKPIYPVSTSLKSLSKDFIKFHRSIKKNRDNMPLSGSGSRKRSWESDEKVIDNIILTSHLHHHNGKRSKSLVLTQELEGLCLNLNHNKAQSNHQKQLPLFIEIDEWAEQDFNPSPSNNNLIYCFDDLKRELDSYNGGSIDEVLKILCSSNISNNSNISYHMNHWIKWGVINEVIESLNPPEITLKLLINRSLSLLAALNRISMILDWNDPEVLFLLNKFLLSFLKSSINNIRCIRCNNIGGNNIGVNISNNSHHRNTGSFIGILRVLNLFCRLPITSSTFNFLLSRPDTSNQVIKLLESLLETILTVFEYSASFKVIISEGFDTVDLANCSVFLTLKVIEKFKLPENEEIIEKLMKRIHTL